MRQKGSVYFSRYCALSDAAGASSSAACRHSRTETMQYNATIFYRAKVHNYDLEERSFYIVGTKGAFDSTKALGSKERVCQRVEKAYQT